MALSIAIPMLCNEYQGTRYYNVLDVNGFSELVMCLGSQVSSIKCESWTEVIDVHSAQLIICTKELPFVNYVYKPQFTCESLISNSHGKIMCKFYGYFKYLNLLQLLHLLLNVARIT